MANIALFPKRLLIFLATASFQAKRKIHPYELNQTKANSADEGNGNGENVENICDIMEINSSSAPLKRFGLDLLFIDGDYTVLSFWSI